MKILSIIFLVVGIICLVVMGFDFFATVERGDNFHWMDTGAPIIASFCLAASLALYAARRKKKKDSII